jgi:hypothetical protein
MAAPALHLCNELETRRMGYAAVEPAGVRESARRWWGILDARRFQCDPKTRLTRSAPSGSTPPARHLDRCGSVAHIPVASRTALLGHLLVVDRAASCHLRISLRRPSSQLTCSPFTATLSISRPCTLGLLAPMRSRDWRHELTRLLFADFDGQVRRIIALWSVRPASTCKPSLRTVKDLVVPGLPTSALYFEVSV